MWALHGEGSQCVCCTRRSLVDAQGGVPEHVCCMRRGLCAWLARRALCAVHREGSGNVRVA